MFKKSLVLGVFIALTACGPSPQPPADQTAANQPPAAAAPQPPAAAQPAPSAADEEAAKVRAEERRLERLKREEAAARAQQQVAQNAPPPPAQQQVCQDCGTVASVTPVRQTGQAGWVGTLGGAAAGGLAGNQFGKGKGNTAMTVLGAIGGAFAGREVEKQVNATTVYQVVVNMDAGGQRTVTISNGSGLAPGTKVHVDGNNLQPY